MTERACNRARIWIDGNEIGVSDRDRMQYIERRNNETNESILSSRTEKSR